MIQKAQQMAEREQYSMTNRKVLSLAVIAGILFVAAYYPILKILAIKWAASEDYTHAFFTVPIILYMAWTKKESFITGVGWGKTGLAVLLASAIFYILSLQLQIPTFIALALFLTVCGIILYLSGPRVILAMTIPLLLLLLLIPIPEQLLSMVTASLQLRVSEASELILRLFGVPLFREGNVLTIPEKTFQVVEACSGIRSLISLVTLSLILGYFSLKAVWSNALLVLCSLPVAILINIMRVVALVVAYHFFQLDLSLGTAHTVLGLALFGIALVVLFTLQRMLEQWETAKKNN